MCQAQESLLLEKQDKKKGLFARVKSCVAVAVVASALLLPASVLAAVPAEVTDAIDIIKADGILIGGIVLVVVASLMGFGIILKMLGLLR